MPFLEVVKAQYLEDYKLYLWFSNHEERIVDLSQSLVGPVFEPLKDKKQFSHFTVKFNTVEWENGADFAPEYLYEISEAVDTKVAEEDGSSEYKKAR